jgi:pSer/pThr/pTyr-binding forkhead associated (FHA) protein
MVSAAPPIPSAPQPLAAEAPRPSQLGPLATLVVRSGALKGQRVEARTPVVNVGRADYNDLCLADPSVSTSHAKLQRRAGVWVLVDLDSTNGCFVDGERVQGEVPIAPGAIIKFGDVELLFEPTDDALGVGKGGGTVVMKSFAPPAPPKPAVPVPASTSPPPAAPLGPSKLPPKPRSPAPVKAAPKSAKAPTPPKKKGKGCGASMIVLLVGASGIGAALYWILA